MFRLKRVIYNVFVKGLLKEEDNFLLLFSLFSVYTFLKTTFI